MNPCVIEVQANPDFTLELTFENGERRIFDMSPYLSIGVFKELTNLTLFKKVKPFMGSISRKNGQDLCPDTLYIDSKKIYRSQHKIFAVAEPKKKYGKKKS